MARLAAPLVVRCIAPFVARRLALCALLVVAACGDPPQRENEAATLFRAAVWEPSRQAFEPALAAADALFAAGDAQPTLDDAFVLGAAALLGGETERGVAALDGLRRAQPQRPGVLLLEGYWQSVRHSRAAARGALTACIAALETRRDAEVFAPEVEFLARLYRGEENYFAQDYDGAVRDLLRAKALLEQRGAPPHRELLRFLADAHVQNQEYGPAEKVLREALAVEPEVPAHHFQLGMVLAAQARSEEATAAYGAALELTPGDPRPRLKLAEIARRDGDLTAMRAQLDALAARHAEGSLGGELSGALGAYQLAMGRDLAAADNDAAAQAAYVSAREHLLRAVERNPLCTRAYTLLVQVASLLGREGDVARYKRRLEELDHAKSSLPAASDPNRTFC